MNEKSQFLLPANVFNQFRDYLIKRYGQPDKIEKGTTQNIMGATFPKVILTWYTSDGPMVLENPSGSIDEFSLFMCQRGLEKEFDRRNKEIAEQNADKAFWIGRKRVRSIFCIKVESRGPGVAFGYAVASGSQNAA